MIYDNDHDTENGVEEKTRLDYDQFINAAKVGSFHSIEEWEKACKVDNSSRSNEELSLFGSFIDMLGYYGTTLYVICIVVLFYALINLFVSKRKK